MVIDSHSDDRLNGVLYERILQSLCVRPHFSVLLFFSRCSLSFSSPVFCPPPFTFCSCLLSRSLTTLGPSHLFASPLLSVHYVPFLSSIIPYLSCDHLLSCPFIFPPSCLFLTLSPLFSPPPHQVAPAPLRPSPARRTPPSRARFASPGP